MYYCRTTTNKKKTKKSKLPNAPFKRFIKKNFSNLYLKIENEFDSMVDSVSRVEGSFEKVRPASDYLEHKLGVAGLWLVGQSRDYFTEFDNGIYKGIEYCNCCGSGIIAIKKEVK